MQALADFLRFPDSKGVSHSLREFHEDLQKAVWDLKPWQLIALGYDAAVSKVWDDEEWQERQLDFALPLIPEDVHGLLDTMCFYEMEEISNAREFDYPVDVWYWLFRQDPCQPRQAIVPVQSGTMVTAPLGGSGPRPSQPPSLAALGRETDLFGPGEGTASAAPSTASREPLIALQRNRRRLRMSRQATSDQQRRPRSSQSGQLIDGSSEDDQLRNRLRSRLDE